MNRERLKTLRDHLAGLPDAQFDMSDWGEVSACGTVACIGGWASVLFGDGTPRSSGDNDPYVLLGLTPTQGDKLCVFVTGSLSEKTRYDAIAAIDSMLANPDDLALPVWPEKAVSA